MGTARFASIFIGLCWLSGQDAGIAAERQPSPRSSGTTPSSHERGSCAPSQMLFYCATKNGKEILLCDKGKTIDYSFGKPGRQAEIALSVPRDQATTSQWEGIGRWTSYSVTVPNGNARYTVSFGVDRLEDEHEIEAGVSVTVDGKDVATIPCKEPVLNNLEGVDLKREPE